jgi:DNA-binding SARP family transcriptional activator
VPLGGSRPKALLAALLLHRNEPVTTDQLIDMLWPDGGPEQPAKTIHVHVSRLRRALADPLAPSVLETHTGSYVLRVGPGELDVDRFTQLVAEGRDTLAAGDPAAASESLSAALGLWRGKALADFTYEPFAQAEIAHLEELRLGAVELAVDADLALGHHAMAVPRLERLTAEHPMRERMHGQLMLALYRCGRQADALAAYRRLRQTLDGELGLEPGPELRRLEQRILRQEADLEAEAPGAAPPAAAPARPAEPHVPLPDPLAHAATRPLAGRDAELAGIAQLAAGLTGSRHLVVLSGDAGIGKTRLLAEAAARLHADGWPVLYGRADEDSPVPYQPFVEAMRHHLAHRPRLALPPGERLPSAAAPLSALLPELEPLLPDERPPTWEEPETGRSRLYVAFATVLSQVAAEDRLALVLDDLHWADPPTLRLIRELVTRPGRAELVVLAAYRDGDLDPDSPLSRPQPLARLVADLRREQRVTRMRLAGLGEEEIAALAATREAVAPPPVVRALHAATRGNPFLVEHMLPELVAAAGESCDDRDVVAALEAVGVPEAIKELLGRRVQALPPGVAETLAAAAVLGDEFRLGQLESIVPAELRPVLPAVETALHSQLVEPREEVDRFAFAHELLRRTLYAALSKSRAARLHLLAAESLEQAGAGPAELARHYWAARDIGGAEQAATCYIALARAHAAAHEHGEAVGHYHKALLALKRAPENESLHCEALLGLAASLEQLDIGKSRAVYRRAAVVARQAGDAEARGRAAVGFARFQPYASIDREAVALLESAEAILPQEPSAVRSQVQCMLGVRLEPAEQDRRERLWRQAAEMARAVGDDGALTAILRYAPYVLWRPESLEERIDAADETVRRAEQAGLADQALWGQVNVVVEQLERGDVARADAALAAARELAAGTRHRWFEWHLPMLLATRALLAGDLEAGEQLAQSSLHLRTRQEPGATETYAAQSAMRARLEGHADEAVVARVEEHAARFPDRPVWRALHADALLAAGRDDEARDVLGPLSAGDRLPTDIDRLAVIALTAEAAARLGATEHAATLGDALAAFPGRFVLIDRAWAVWGTTSRVLGVVAVACGDVAAATQHFESAAREHSAAGANAWLAHTLADHADVLIGAGDRRGAERLADRALVLARTHGLDGLVARLERVSPVAPPSA